MDWQNFLSFIAQISGSLSAWPTIFSNIAAFAVVFLTRNLIHRWYVTLVDMDNSIITAASWLFMLSVYALIYKAVFACFKGVENYKASRLKEKENTERKERMMKNILALSKQEIAILKFVLTQESFSAWLPDNFKPVMLLVQYGYLVQIGMESKTVSDLQLSFNYSLAHLFTVPENIRQIIANIPQQFIQKWRRIKPDRRFQNCQ